MQQIRAVEIVPIVTDALRTRRHLDGSHGVCDGRAEAAVYDAKLNVGYCSVRAPYNGYVTNLNIADGQYANEGRQVVSLIDDRKW